MTELLGSLIVLGGAFFLFAAGFGVLRMPDSYNRIQAGTKASTLGTILVLLGMGVYHPAWIGKLLLLIFFIVLTNPVSSHALARAAHSRHVHLSRRTVVDQLEAAEAAEEQVVEEKEVQEA